MADVEQKENLDLTETLLSIGADEAEKLQKEISADETPKIGDQEQIVETVEEKLVETEKVVEETKPDYMTQDEILEIAKEEGTSALGNIPQEKINPDHRKFIKDLTKMGYKNTREVAALKEELKQVKEEYQSIIRQEREKRDETSIVKALKEQSQKTREEEEEKALNENLSDNERFLHQRMKDQEQQMNEIIGLYRQLQQRDAYRQQQENISMLRDKIKNAAKMQDYDDVDDDFYNDVSAKAWFDYNAVGRNANLDDLINKHVISTVNKLKPLKAPPSADRIEEILKSNPEIKTLLKTKLGKEYLQELIDQKKKSTNVIPSSTAKMVQETKVEPKVDYAKDDLQDGFDKIVEEMKKKFETGEK